MNDRSVYPLGKRRTLIVFFGLMLGMLLAALDQTIVSTALPRITTDLGGFEHYSWVFSAYMLGATVTVLREADTRQTFRIVGEDEADPAAGSISYVAPLARALTGKGVGDTVTVNGHDFEIAEIR